MPDTMAYAAAMLLRRFTDISPALRRDYALPRSPRAVPRYDFVVSAAFDHDVT